ncbi:hypothetical protein S7711_10978 [Stachybotrys chartarum IBT 7711]|uniref:Uncharacterized protein n=1 Tax=Stachybotrys chartarum (strain CBS 109288 / IBT 7711) TaxID=1280523 RepID=A0A084ATE4_STACB|nr:hypothetical protein S7711_10978 [Stachybotrys chartarum IBT 7711]
MISLIQQPVFAALAAPAAKKASPLEHFSALAATHLDQARHHQRLHESLEEEESAEAVSASKIAELVNIKGEEKPAFLSQAREADDTSQAHAERQLEAPRRIRSHRG